MSQKITQKDLESLVARINTATGSPATTYTKTGNKLAANVGNFHLDYACGGGGVKLSRITNNSRATISTGGYGTKRELYHWMQAFLAGFLYRNH